MTTVGTGNEASVDQAILLDVNEDGRITLTAIQYDGDDKGQRGYKGYSVAQVLLTEETKQALQAALEGSTHVEIRP